jgi:GNAT superfamily N-acetyltransferase
MQKMKGKTMPFGWIRLLKALKGKNDTVDLLLIAVRPDLQGQGVNAIILDDMQHKLIKAGVRYAETGPMLEINDHILAQWERFQGVQHKRRRCFVKEL